MMNFDAAVSEGGSTLAISVVVRDSRGEFFAGLNKHCNYIKSVEIAELHTRFEAIRFALKADFWDIEPERDNLTVCTTLEKEETNLVNGGVIVLDILYLAQS